MIPSSSSGLRPIKTAAPKRNRATVPPPDTLKATGLLENWSERSNPLRSMRSANCRARAGKDVVLMGGILAGNIGPEKCYGEDLGATARRKPAAPVALARRQWQNGGGRVLHGAPARAVGRARPPRPGGVFRRGGYRPASSPAPRHGPAQRS